VVHNEQDIWNHLTHGGTGEDDTTPDPSADPRGVLAGLENRFGSSFDRLADSAKEPDDDPNPYAGQGKGKSALEADGLQTGADFLHNQGVNPSPTVTGNPTTPIGDAAQQAHLEDDLVSGRATRHTSSDGTVTSTKSNDGTTVVEDKNNNTKTTLKPDGSTVTQDLTTGKVTDTTKPSTSMPDEDHQTVLPKNFNPGQFDADGHIERARQSEHRHDPTNTDPTDGDPSVTAVPTSGPIHDAKTELLGDPKNPNSPDFGSGAGHGTLPNQGSIPTDPNHGGAIDPGEQADTGPPQTTGPSERIHHNPTPSLQSGESHAGSGSGHQSSDPGDGHGGGGTAVPAEPHLTNPNIPHIEVPDHTPAPSRDNPHARSSHHATSDPATAEAQHPAPPPPAATGGATHVPIEQHAILPDPTVPDAHLAHPAPTIGGEPLHDPTAEHPILPEPAVPEDHHVEVPPPAHGGEAIVDPASHHPIPEPETHHDDFHFPG
jgi:hypothetical protein